MASPSFNFSSVKHSLQRYLQRTWLGDLSISSKYLLRLSEVWCIDTSEIVELRGRCQRNVSGAERVEGWAYRTSEVEARKIYGATSYIPVFPPQDHFSGSREGQRNETSIKLQKQRSVLRILGSWPGAQYYLQ